MSTRAPDFVDRAAALPAASSLLARVRAAWRRAIAARAMVVACAAGVGAATALVLLDRVVPLPADLRRLLLPLPPIAVAVPLVAALRRLFPGPDDRRLALLVEERTPALDGSLSTALEPLGDGPVARAFRARTEALLGRVDPRAVVPLGLRRSGATLGLGAMVAAAVVATAPGGAAGLWQRWSRAADATTGAGVRAEMAGPPPGTPVADPRFGEIRFTVRPPSYTGLPAHGWTGEAAVAALPGSRIVVRGGRPEGADTVVARVVGGPDLQVRSGVLDGRDGRDGRDGPPGSGGGWAIEWTVAPGERGLSIEAGAAGEIVARRVVPLILLQDRAPVVELLEPAEDLVAATPTGELAVRATARDDYGVDAFHLSWIRSRGSGESFSFDEGSWPWTELRREGGPAGDGRLQGEFRLDLAAAGLEPGDVLHLRAVARDRNTVTGPGEGVSRTRVIRIARAGAMEEATTLVGFPIEAEKEPILSQRMIILLTERLRDRLPTLDREEALHEATEIAEEQARLRSRVGDQVFTRATGGMQTPDEGIGFEETSGAAGGHGHAGAAGGHGQAREGAAAARSRVEEVLEAASRATGTGTIEEIEHRHDAAPILAVSQPLLDAYNAMWAAERALQQAEPDSALPHQYEALRILQELRQAERVFLRARQRVAPVDLDAARGTGKLDDAEPAPRSAGQAASTPATHLAGLEEIAERLPRLADRDAALELTALAAQVLADPAADPAAATLLARAADAVAAGDRVEGGRLLLRARTALAPAMERGTGPPVGGAVDGLSARYFQRLGGRRP